MCELIQLCSGLTTAVGKLGIGATYSKATVSLLFITLVYEQRVLFPICSVDLQMCPTIKGLRSYVYQLRTFKTKGKKCTKILVLYCFRAVVS